MKLPMNSKTFRRQKHADDWTARYRRERRRPLTRLIRFCRRHDENPIFIVIVSALLTGCAYAFFLAYIYSLVHSPLLQP